MKCNSRWETSAPHGHDAVWHHRCCLPYGHEGACECGECGAQVPTTATRLSVRRPT